MRTTRARPGETGHDRRGRVERRDNQPGRATALAVPLALPAERLIRDLTSQHPEALTALVGVIVVLVVAQRFLGPEDDWVESRRADLLLSVAELLSALRLDTLGLFTTGRSYEAELAATLEGGPDDAERALYGAGFHRNLLAAKKSRATADGDQPSESSWVHRESILSPKQTHVTLYPNPDGTTDAYAHREWSVTRPIKHYFGDPEPCPERFRALLDAGGQDAARTGHNAPEPRDVDGSGGEGE